MATGGEVSDTDSVAESESLIATQTEKDIFLELSEKYGGLPKDQFREEFVSEFPHKEIVAVRQSLYDLALQTNPDTPVGKLAIRKDRIGGAPADDKMAEEFFGSAALGDTFVLECRVSECSSCL